MIETYCNYRNYNSVVGIAAGKDKQQEKGGALPEADPLTRRRDL